MIIGFTPKIGTDPCFNRHQRQRLRWFQDAAFRVHPVLSLSRRSLYYQPVGPAPVEVVIKHAIDQIYTAHPTYGSRRIAVVLGRDHQLVVNRKAVQRYMREMGIAGISPGPNLSQRAVVHRVYPYLLRGLVVARPNHVWQIDITSIRLSGGWMYLVAVLDVYARFIVSWALDGWPSRLW